MLQSLFVIDHDAETGDALSAIFSPRGYSVFSFANGDEFFIAAALNTPSCVLLEMDGIHSGLDILQRMSAENYPAPVLAMSAEADIAMAVQAVKFGAFDFIEKPFDAAHVVKRVHDAVAASMQRWENSREHDLRFVTGGEKLTARERDVLKQITGGASNKEAGRELGISPRTIEVHRARIMQKLSAKNAADLVRIVLGQREMLLT